MFKNMLAGHSLEEDHIEPTINHLVIPVTPRKDMITRKMTIKISASTQMHHNVFILSSRCSFTISVHKHFLIRVDFVWL